jgi:hypothetical protein
LGIPAILADIEPGITTLFIEKHGVEAFLIGESLFAGLALVCA